MRLLFLLLFLLAGYASPAASPPDSLRLISPLRLLGYTYANDLFFRTDYYFTQGMTLNLVHPALAHSPVNYLLAKGPAGSTQYFGIKLRYDGFTPLRIQDDVIRAGDRPYSAYFYASFYRISNQTLRHRRLTTALEVGFIGPAAGGKPLQTFLHQLTGNAAPRGWDYQIRNDAVLGYHLTFEQQLFATSHAELIGSAEASLSTLYTYASAGTKLRIGLLNPYFDNFSVATSHQWQLYAQAALEGRAIGYDATLQGGIFNRESPYTLTAGQLRRAVWHSSGSLVVAHAGWSFSATAVYVSAEFAGGRTHRWGQMGLAKAF